MRQLLMWVTVALFCTAGAAAGSERPEARLREAQAALDEAEELSKARKYAEAIARAEHALALRETVLGSTNPRVAEVLDALGRFHTAQGLYSRAEPLFQRALSIQEKAFGKSHRLVAAELERLGNIYRAQGAYDRAVPIYERLLAIEEARRDQDPTALIDTLTLLGSSYWHQELDAKAQPFYERALSIGEAALGKDDPNISGLLSNLARVYQDQGLYTRAEALYLRSVAVVEAAGGKNHPGLTPLLNNLANLYSAQKLYAQAEPLYLRSLALGEATLGKEHPHVLQALDNLAGIYKKQRLYTRAEPLYLRSLAAREANQDQDPQAVVDSLEKLADLYILQALSAQAEPFLQRALALREELSGREHPSVAYWLTRLADVYFRQGMYTRAEPLYERALALLEGTPSQGAHLVSALSGLANIYMSQGLFSKARALLERALSIAESNLGQSHPSLIPPLIGLAACTFREGKLVEARARYQRALAITEAAFGKTDPLVVGPLINLASFEMSLGDYARAEPLLQRALAVGEETLGEKHPDVARVLIELASLYQDQGFWERADSLLDRALPIWEATLGENHPYSDLLLDALAWRFLREDRPDEALPVLQRELALSERRLREEALGFAETRLDSFLDHLPSGEENIYVLLALRPDDARVRRLALSAVLLRKGRSVAELADTSRTLHRSLSTEDRDTFERLRGLRTQIAMLSLPGPGSPTPANHLKNLEDQANALEAELARRSAPLRALTTLPGPDEIVDRVTQGLPSDGALVEFIRDEQFKILPPRPGTRDPRAYGKSHYVAIVLFPDGQTRTVDLGNTAPIDRAAVDLRNALARRDAEVQVPAQALYQLAFQPLLPLLGKTRRLFLSPEGQLSLVPFAALHDGHQFLVDSFDFTYLTSGRELLPRAQGVAPSTSVVVLADPDFRAPLQAPPAAPADTTEQTERSGLVARFFATHRADLTEGAWVPLPGTRREAEAIQRLIPQAQLFLGAAATKERLLHLPTPGVLHLATHGFFLEDDTAVSKGSRAVGHFGALGESTSSRLPPHALLRSGLVLAGARAPAQGAARPRLDSALVTASEMAGLDLWGTQLVVLSACDTGRGEVRKGQGVYGLRRALIAAGAETVVMSLWQVSDGTTSQLMETYYRNLLEGQGRATALREAMRALRSRHPHPHFWAPFIVLGRDTPLSGLALPPQPSPKP
ncbi:tetratricopeptide repeat protein [Archangium violaceum]|uniref:CHAT domain-containing tetratricopeptide repeat protein n=1 Tax=Archangium violaceum TaxID=83451 RepID=UPI00195098F3|nr:CHAT domain-containing protein [Archangium violaceum]QRN97037.1 tetratricopeptide repeat protein [Archangium violaceum]